MANQTQYSIKILNEITKNIFEKVCVKSEKYQISFNQINKILTLEYRK